jgi:hypothetical protein
MTLPTSAWKRIIPTTEALHRCGHVCSFSLARPPQAQGSAGFLFSGPDGILSVHDILTRIAILMVPLVLSGTCLFFFAATVGR